MIRNIVATTTLSLLMGVGSALAEPALKYAVGSKFDKSFNESAHNGAQRWA